MLILEQMLNGLQLGMMLFLIAAGLTLVFGIMNLVNLAHGALYMIGAYVWASTMTATGSFLLAVTASLTATTTVGIAIELTVFRELYRRDHLDQVLATFGLIIFFNEAVRMIWGAPAIFAPVPQFLSGQIELIGGIRYPLYRLAIIGVGLAVAAMLFVFLKRTRIGMLIRAGATNRTIVAALGANIWLLYTIIFGLGAMLAALSGLMAAPIYAVQSGMGDNVLILAFVVIVVGGVGSVHGSFIAAILVGLVDTLGRALIRPSLATILPPDIAANAGPALASMLTYILMALVLFFRPRGLFAPVTR